ncbi:hypothetical protein H257_13297 [Aphanomyces astaci]|uniref:Uncharacterized protein n=1 Tax=Aphanomyces astaci TaxID=112090 RepID=W4FWU2_APHAT|nr:hypothetical protein H257_13297 [Aphanomyces astaci]ETV71411.1 hypothetical protein H257_13297 [Aphanomyces astaci]|eukprot:XP_009839076.1 hypothetical protein H257_13297 [Aphanomyces astaci]
MRYILHGSGTVMVVEARHHHRRRGLANGEQTNVTREICHFDKRQHMWSSLASSSSPSQAVLVAPVASAELASLALAMGASKMSCATALAHQSRHGIATDPTECAA